MSSVGRNPHQSFNIVLELANDPKKMTFVVTQTQEAAKENVQLNRKYPGSNEKQCQNCGQRIQINLYFTKAAIPEEVYEPELKIPMKHQTVTVVPDIKIESDGFEVFAENDSLLIYGVKDELNDPTTSIWDSKDTLEFTDFSQDNDQNSSDSDSKPLKVKKKTVKDARSEKKTKANKSKGVRLHSFSGKIDIPYSKVVRCRADFDPQTNSDWENLYSEERRLARQVPYYKILDLSTGEQVHFLKYNRTGNFYMANFDLRPITCDICGAKTKEMPQLIKHRNLHFFERNSELKCAACAQEFDNYELLTRHVLICKEKHKLSGDRCKYCDKRFGSYASLRQHVILHVPHLLPESRQQKICEICSKICSDQERLRTHRRRVHKIDAYSCDHCKKVFAERPEIQKHLIRKHFPQLAPIRCSYCNSPFTTACALKTHINQVHMRSLDVECEVCQKKMRPNSLKAHMSKHMNLEERKKFFCHTCGKIFFNPVALEGHIATLHQEPDQWEFMCETCGKKLPTKFKYSEHVKAHTRPIAVCNVCNKAFSSKQYLKDHLNLHSGEKPYVCKVCDKRFADRGCLRNHLKHHEASMGVKLTLNPEERRLQRQGVLNIELPNGLT